MDQNHEASISAIAIALGMNFSSGASAHKIGEWCAANCMGQVELYSGIATLGELSDQLATELLAVAELPGVYVYGVDEEFGSWLVAAITTFAIDSLEEPRVKRTLGGYASRFMEKGGPLAPEVDAVIARLTGYERGREVVAVQVVPVIVHCDHVEPQFAGPTELTNGWAVYDRLEDGTVSHYKDEANEDDAMAVGQQRADTLDVEIEHQPWRQA